MVRRIKFGTAPLKWIIQICSREKPEQLFLLLNLWSSASKTFITDNGNTVFVWMQEKQHWTLKQSWAEAYCLVGWLFWVGDRKQPVVTSLTAYHLRSQGALAHLLGNIWSRFRSQVHTGHPCMACPSLLFDKELFIFGASFLVGGNIWMKKNLRDSDPSYHIFGKSRLN